MILSLLKRISNSLEEKQIPYMLSGSLALNIYTIPRMTLDIDIVIDLKENKLQDFFSIFGEGYYINKQTVEEETKCQGMFNIIDYETGFKIDFIIRKDTTYHKLEFERRRKIKITDFITRVVSPEDLIIAKIKWIQEFQSDKQTQDIRNLLANPSIDKQYIKEWCKELDLKTFELL